MSKAIGDSAKKKAKFAGMYMVGCLGAKYSRNAMKRLISLAIGRKLESGKGETSFKFNKLAHDIVNPIRLVKSAVQFSKGVVYLPEILAEAALTKGRKWVENSDNFRLAKGAAIAVPMLAAGIIKCSALLARQTLAVAEVGLEVAEKIVENPKKVVLGTAKVTAWTAARALEVVGSVALGVVKLGAYAAGKKEFMQKVTEMESKTRQAMYKKEKQLYSKIDDLSESIAQISRKARKFVSTSVKGKISTPSRKPKISKDGERSL